MSPSTSWLLEEITTIYIHGLNFTLEREHISRRSLFQVFHTRMNNWRQTTLPLSFLYFHWLFPLSSRETSSGNRSIYKSTRERVDSKGLHGRWRLHPMGSWYHRFLRFLRREGLEKGVRARRVGYGSNHFQTHNSYTPLQLSERNKNSLVRSNPRSRYQWG